MMKTTHQAVSIDNTLLSRKNIADNISQSLKSKLIAQ